MQLSRTQSVMKHDNEIKTTELKYSWKSYVMQIYIQRFCTSPIPALHTAFLLVKELLIWKKRTENITEEK